MLYIHGGSFLYGGANLPVFDCVNLVSHSVARGSPVVCVNFNYRVGLGGFLASSVIKADLERDGKHGVGNFGLYDQQVAIQWVSQYVSSFGGDPDNITIYGESAGGMSVAHQLAAKDPAPFHRAIAISGNLNTLPTWTLEHHEKHYCALLKYLEIDPDAPDSLEQLRKVPQQAVADATLHVEGVFVATGNPCYDGTFHTELPDPNKIRSPPKWLKSYMVSDTWDEAMIASEALAEEDFASLRSQLINYMGESNTDIILGLYDIKLETGRDDFLKRLERMVSDSAFNVQNWLSVHKSEIPQTYGYHFDQPCTHGELYQGLAYHALDLLYLFRNFDEQLTPAQIEMSKAIASQYIDFAYGKDPWTRFSQGQSWMRYGPDAAYKVVTEAEDEAIRRYSRLQKIIDLGVLKEWNAATDDIGIKRKRMGTFEWQPPKIGKYHPEG
ncbi:hypothetical protein ACHAPJ_012373 [Fusarium lateritium]